MYQVWLKSFDIYSLLSRNENMGVSLADNAVKIWQNLPISNPKPDHYNIHAHTKFGENPLMFTQVIIRKRNTDGWTYDWQTDRLRNWVYVAFFGTDGSYVAIDSHTSPKN